MSRNFERCTNVVALSRTSVAYGANLLNFAAAVLSLEWMKLGTSNLVCRLIVANSSRHDDDTRDVT